MKSFYANRHDARGRVIDLVEMQDRRPYIDYSIPCRDDLLSVRCGAMDAKRMTFQKARYILHRIAKSVPAPQAKSHLHNITLTMKAKALGWERVDTPQGWRNRFLYEFYAPEGRRITPTYVADVLCGLLREIDKHTLEKATGGHFS